MSKPIQDDCFSRAGFLSDAIIKEHIVPSLGVGAADTIKKAGWDGESAALAIGLTIDTTGEHIRNCFPLQLLDIFGDEPLRKPRRIQGCLRT